MGHTLVHVISGSKWRCTTVKERPWAPLESLSTRYRTVPRTTRHERSTRRTQVDVGLHLCDVTRRNTNTNVSRNNEGMCVCAPSAYRVWCVYMCGAWACLQRPGWSVRHRRNGGGTHGRARLLLCICVCIRVSVGPHITSLGWQTGARFSWQKRNSR